MSFENLFYEHILLRGYDYYLEDRVIDFHLKGNKIEAVVSGYDDYNIIINLENNAVKSMYCDCPYAADGHNCKHMAAVLYTWENNEYEAYDDSDDSLDGLLESASQNQLKAFLTKVFSDDPKLYERFKIFVKDKLSDYDLRKYRQSFDKIISRYAYNDNYIAAYNVWDFSQKVAHFIENDVSILVDKGYCLEAYRIISSIIEQLGYLDIEDFDGELCLIADEVDSLCHRILDVADEKATDAIYNHIADCLHNGYEQDYLHDYILNIYINCFNQPKYLKDKLEYAKAQIAYAKQKNAEHKNWGYTYEIEKWTTVALNILDLSHASDDELYQFCKENWECFKVRHFLIDKCMNSHDYKHAIELLEESIQLDKNDHKDLIKDYRYKLKDLYKSLHYINDYKETLWYLLTEDDKGNLGCFKEYKSLYNEKEWINQRTLLFNSLDSFYKADLYVEEKMFDDLLDYVINDSHLDSLIKYQEHLEKLYPKELLDKYEKELNEMAESTTGRKAYQYWVSLLRKMITIEGGLQRASSIAKQWKIKYYNRRALKEELNKLFFCI